MVMGQHEEPPSAPVFEPPPFKAPNKSSARRPSKPFTGPSGAGKSSKTDPVVSPKREKPSRSSKTRSTSLDVLEHSERRKSSRASKLRSVSPFPELQEDSELKSKRSTRKTTEVVTTEKTTTETSFKNDALASETLAQKEARSILRRERRARDLVLKEEQEAALRKKETEEEAASSSDEEEGGNSGGTKIDANLSNQNNVTVNVPGLADIANAMTEMTKLAAQLVEEKAKASKKSVKKVAREEEEEVTKVKTVKSKPKKAKEVSEKEMVRVTKVKSKPKKIEEITEEEVEVGKKVKAKSKSKKIVDLSEEEEEMPVVKKRVSKKPAKEAPEADDEDFVAEDLAKRLTVAKKAVNKNGYEEADMEYFRNARKRPGQPRLHLSEETTITRNTIQNWLDASEKSFCQLFWEIVYSYPRYTVLHLLGLCSEWYEGNMNNLRFAGGLWEVKQAPGHDGLAWFLTQHHETAVFLRWAVFKAPGIGALEAKARATGGRVYCLDPLGLCTVDQVASIIHFQTEMLQLESMGLAKIDRTRDNPFSR